VLHVSLDGLYKIGDQIMAPSKLNIDLGERIANSVAFVNKAVVDANYPEYYRGDNAQEDQE